MNFHDISIKVKYCHRTTHFKKGTYITGSIGKVQWFNNWVAFMDNLLQMKIIRQDTRGLFVPTSIEKVVINIKTHLQALQAVDEEVKGY